MRFKLRFLFLLLLLPSAVFSQNVHSGAVVFAGIGFTVPAALKEFAKSYKAGYNLNAGGGYIFNKNYAVRLDLQYNNFTFKETDPGYSGKFISYSITGNFMAGDFSKNSSLSPYGVAGIGAFVNSEKISTPELSVSSSVINLGSGFGGGMNVKVSEKIGMFIEFEFMLLFHQGTARAYMPLKAGVTFRI